MTKEEIIAQPEFQNMMRIPYKDERDFILKHMDKNFGKVLKEFWYYFRDDYTCTYPAYESRTVNQYEAFWEQIKTDFPKPAPTPKSKARVAAKPHLEIPTDEQITHMCKILNLDWDFVIKYLKEHWENETD